jgi:hypothetical protein
MSPAKRSSRLTGPGVSSTELIWEAGTAGRSSDGLPNQGSTLKPEMVLSELDFLAFWPIRSAGHLPAKKISGLTVTGKVTKLSVSNGRAFLSGNSGSR